MGSGVKTFLITLVLVFTVLNIVSVNILHPSVHDASIEKAFKKAEELRNLNKALPDMKSFVIKDHHGDIITKPLSKDVFHMSTILDRLLYYFPYIEEEEVETNIYQIWRVPEDTVEFPTSCNELINRWRDANPEYFHTVLSIEEAESLVVDILRPTVPEIVDALRLMPYDRLKFDFLKYLVIYLNGGVYADIDTINVKPVKFWASFQMVPSKLWLGVDADYNGPDWESNYYRRLTFTNNIIRSKAHHPLLARLIARIAFIMFTQKDIITAIDWEKEYSVTDSSGAPMIQFTGTSILTDTAFEYLNQLENAPYFTSLRNKNYGKEKDNIVLLKKTFGPDVDPNQRFSYKKFTLLSGPVQVADITILPKVSFTGYDSAQVDAFDDENKKIGYDQFFYGRSKDLTEWSPKKVRLDSN